MTCEDYRAKYPAFSTPLSREVFESDAFGEWAAHGQDCRKCTDWSMRKELDDRGVDVATFPCVHLAYHSTMTCDLHVDPWECPDMTLVRDEDAGFGIPVRDGGTSVIRIRFCPWCGSRC